MKLRIASRDWDFFPPEAFSTLSKEKEKIVSTLSSQLTELSATVAFSGLRLKYTSKGCLIVNFVKLMKFH